MKRAKKIGSVFGIGVYVHWSFLLIPTWVTVSLLTAGAGWSGVFWEFVCTFGLWVHFSARVRSQSRGESFGHRDQAYHYVTDWGCRRFGANASKAGP